jgi:hypothetical protein
MLELRDSTSIADDTEAMGQRLAEDGYLLFRGVIDRESVSDVRRQVLEVLGHHGWLEPGSPVEEARPSAPERWTFTPEFLPAYKDVQSLEAVHRLAHHRGFGELFRTIYGAGAYCIPPKVVRLIYPGPPSLQIHPHKDYASTGIPDMLTCWFPLGDCPRPMGGLAVLPGSQYRPISLADSEVFDPSDPWSTTDYEAGDALLFHCLTTHVSRLNQSNTLRMSIDARWASSDWPIPDYMMVPDRFGTKANWKDLGASWATQRWREIPADVRVLTGVPAGVNVRHPDSRWLHLDSGREAIDIQPRESVATGNRTPWYTPESMPT